MSSEEVSKFLTLRGTYFLPELQEQGLLQRIGSGALAHAYPLDQEHVLIQSDNAVTVYSLTSKKLLWEIDCPSFHFAVDYAQQRIALAPTGTTLLLWNIQTGQILHRLIYPTTSEVYRINPNGLAFNATGKRIAVGMKNDTSSIIVLWDAITGVLHTVFTLEEVFDDITTLAFHPSDKILVGGSFNNRKVWFWSLEEGDLIAVWELGEENGNDRPYTLAFNTIGTLLFVAWGKCGLRIWDMTRMQEVPGSYDVHPTWVTVDPGDRYLAIAHVSNKDSQAIQVREAGSLHVVYELKGKTMQRPRFSADGQLLAVIEAQKSISVREAATGKEISRLQLETLFGTSCALNPEGNLLVSGPTDTRFSLWNVGDNSLLPTFFHLPGDAV